MHIEPRLNCLQLAKGKTPPLLGKISVKLEKVAIGHKAIVMLPKGLEGGLVWQGERKAVTGGKVGR